MVNKEYGEVMRFLLYFRERYQTEDEYRRFLLASMRDLVHDLREFDVFISLQPELFHQPRRVAGGAQSNLDAG